MDGTRVRSAIALLSTSLSNERLYYMRKFVFLLLALLGIGAVAYILTEKRSEAHRLWNETLARIPTPGCDCCPQEDPTY